MWNRTDQNHLKKPGNSKKIPFLSLLLDITKSANFWRKLQKCSRQQSSRDILRNSYIT